MLNFFRASIIISLLFSGTALAAPLLFTVSTTVNAVDGVYGGGLFVGDTITGSFLVDNDKDNASPGSDPGPGTNPGHEYTSFWEFSGPSYGVDLLNVQRNARFTSDIEAIVVNDGLNLPSNDVGGQIPTGTYDWIEVLGSTTSDYCPTNIDCVAEPNQVVPANGEEWTLMIVSTDSWFSGGDIPQKLPIDYTAFLLGFGYDQVGTRVGAVIAPVNSLKVTVVPEPASIFLFASGLFALFRFTKRKITR